MQDSMNTIMFAVHGSHLYGMNTENSDVDYKGIYIPIMKELLLGKQKDSIKHSTGNDKEKNTSLDVEYEIYSLSQFIKMAVDGETICIDMLHTPDNDLIIDSPIWQSIRENRSKFYSKNMKAFLGYAKKQAAKYGIRGSRMAALEEVVNTIHRASNTRNVKTTLYDIWGKLPVSEYCYFTESVLPNGTVQKFYQVLDSKYQNTMPYNLFVKSIQAKWESYGERARLAKENNGIDWKAVSHAIRAAYQLEEIYLTGDLKYPLTKRDYLLQVKRGELDFLSEVQPELERVIAEVEQLAANSSYPEKVDVAFWNEWLYNIYKENAK